MCSNPKTCTGRGFGPQEPRSQEDDLGRGAIRKGRKVSICVLGDRRLLSVLRLITLKPHSTLSRSAKTLKTVWRWLGTRFHLISETVLQLLVWKAHEEAVQVAEV